MLKKLISRLKYRLHYFLTGKNCSRIILCANRCERTTRYGPIEVTTIFKDTRQPDAYLREELYEMLCTVRKHERIQGWKVPEPR